MAPADAGAPPATTGAARRMRARIGGVCAGVALLLIWCCRAALDGNIYVSAMGAAGMVTAPWFNLALLLVGIAAVLMSMAVPDEQPRHRLLSLWPLSRTLLACAMAFGFAAVVPCTMGCPVPLPPSSSWQDLLHVTAAVVGFVGAILAVLQVWSSTGSGLLQAVSAATMLFVAVSAAIGALASFTEWNHGFGGWFEFAATSAALSWVAGLGIALSVERGEQPPQSAPECVYCGAQRARQTRLRPRGLLRG